MKGRHNKVTTFERFNHDKFLRHPSTWAFFVSVGFFAVAFLVYFLMPFVKSLYVLTVVSLSVFVGLSIFGLAKEIFTKSYDYSYMSVGVMGLSLLTLMIAGQTAEFVTMYVSFIFALCAIPFAIIGIVKVLKKNEDRVKIVMNAMVILGSLVYLFFVGFVIVFVEVARTGNNMGW